MKIDLQTNLYNSFPELFYKQLYIECGDGWYDLLFCLFENLNHLKQNIKIVQIKEKFGTLRVYFSFGENVDVSNIVRMAESLSRYICEVCGNRGNTKNINGWLKTLCEECACTRMNKINSKVEFVSTLEPKNNDENESEK